MTKLRLATLPLHAILVAITVPLLLLGAILGVIRLGAHHAGSFVMDACDRLCDAGLALSRWAK